MPIPSTPEPDASPWRGMAGFALGVLGWPPESFWHATPAEFWLAVAGWRRANGLAGTAEPMRGDELARLRARFPDG